MNGRDAWIGIKVGSPEYVLFVLRTQALSEIYRYRNGVSPSHFDWEAEIRAARCLIQQIDRIIEGPARDRVIAASVFYYRKTRTEAIQRAQKYVEVDHA